MSRLQPDEHAASKALGSTVRFVRDDEGRPVRAIVGARWATLHEWMVLRRAGIDVAQKMTPAPARPEQESACPCPGCGRCACAWLPEGPEPCRRSTCICPRLRAPVRLAIRRGAEARAELLIRRGTQVLYCLGTWTQETGWDFTPAGDAKARSLPQVIALVLAREMRGGALLRSIGAPIATVGSA